MGPIERIKKLGRGCIELAENLGGWPAVIVLVLGIAAALIIPYAVAVRLIKRFRPRWYACPLALIAGSALGILANFVTWCAVHAVSSINWIPTQEGVLVLAGASALAALCGTCGIN
jgi:hypothetical protein